MIPNNLDELRQWYSDGYEKLYKEVPDLCDEIDALRQRVAELEESLRDEQSETTKKLKSALFENKLFLETLAKIEQLEARNATAEAVCEVAYRIVKVGDIRSLRASLRDPIDTWQAARGDD